MNLDPKTVGLTIVLFIGAMFLQGCSAFGEVQEATPAETPNVVTITKTVEVAKPSEKTTVRLLEVLDAAGCDFQGVQITEDKVRKGSSTLTVACK